MHAIFCYRHSYSHFRPIAAKRIKNRDSIIIFSPLNKNADLKKINKNGIFQNT